MNLPFGIEGPAKRPSAFRVYARTVLGVASIVIIVLIVSMVAGYLSRRC